MLRHAKRQNRTELKNRTKLPKLDRIEKSEKNYSLAGFDGNDGESADKFQETSLQKHYHKRKIQKMSTAAYFLPGLQ